MTQRYWSQRDGQQLFERVRRLARGEGRLAVLLESRWHNALRWGNNAVLSDEDRRDPAITIIRYMPRGSRGVATTNRSDDYGLALALAQAAQQANYADTDPDPLHPAVERVTPVYSQPPIFVESTCNLPVSEMTATVAHAIGLATQAGVRTTGSARVSVTSRAVLNDAGLDCYAVMTQAQHTVTMRTPTGTGAGWAALDHNDWSKLGTVQLNQQALERCKQSIDPKALEPGRYTVVLEPQAVHDLLRYAVYGAELRDTLLRFNNAMVLKPEVVNLWDDEVQKERRFGHRMFQEGVDRGRFGEPYTDKKGSEWFFTDENGRVNQWEDPGGGRGRRMNGVSIGTRFLDRRLTIASNPMDPECGFLPFDQAGDAYRSTQWFTEGVLSAVGYTRQYGVELLRKPEALPFPGAYRVTVTGPTSSIAEMIKTTERGLLVARFGSIQMINRNNNMMSGVTRDGVWLIEHGAVKTPVKNFRFAESPFFVFNKVEKIGMPVRVFSPDGPAVVPAMKVLDFNMAVLADAI